MMKMGGNGGHGGLEIVITVGFPELSKCFGGSVIDGGGALSSFSIGGSILPVI